MQEFITDPFRIHSRPQTPQTDQNADIANVLQGEHVGEQVWQGVVGVSHRRHEEGHHSTGEDRNYDDVEDNDVEYVEYVVDCPTQLTLIFILSKLQI